MTVHEASRSRKIKNVAWCQFTEVRDFSLVTLSGPGKERRGRILDCHRIGSGSNVSEGVGSGGDEGVLRNMKMLTVCKRSERPRNSSGQNVFRSLLCDPGRELRPLIHHRGAGTVRTVKDFTQIWRCVDQKGKLLSSGLCHFLEDAHHLYSNKWSLSSSGFSEACDSNPSSAETAESERTGHAPHLIRRQHKSGVPVCNLCPST